MQNIQNIPGETDVDQPMPDDRPTSEEDRLHRRDHPTMPPDMQPSAPVKEPSDKDRQKPVEEPNNEPKRIM